MHLFGGLAISYDGGITPFIRWSAAPIIERSQINPFLNTAPFVIEKITSGVCITSAVSAGDMRIYPVITLCRAVTVVIGSVMGREAIPFPSESENALARPLSGKTMFTDVVRCER